MTQTAWSIISPCRVYRYFLAVHTGLPNERIATGVFDNPCAYTDEQTELTRTIWVNYCRAWGFGWAWIVNVRAYRCTDPKDLPSDPEAIGPENDVHIVRAALGAELVVCGWGKLGGERGPVALDLIRRAGKVPHALKLLAGGEPGHPLYLAAKLKPFPMGAA